MFGRHKEVPTPETKPWRPKYWYVVEGTVYHPRHSNWRLGIVHAEFTRTVDVAAYDFQDAAEKSGLGDTINAIHKTRYIG
jgi:hypothetical protein